MTYDEASAADRQLNLEARIVLAQVRAGRLLPVSDAAVSLAAECELRGTGVWGEDSRNLIRLVARRAR